MKYPASHSQLNEEIKAFIAEEVSRQLRLYGIQSTKVNDEFSQLPSWLFETDDTVIVSPQDKISSLQAARRYVENIKKKRL